uniref:Uncharacterized protein n=1 Tax=Anopheles culicifacies TaxID=139723 RepID=A0A182LV37_9DIPT
MKVGQSSLVGSTTSIIPDLTTETECEYDIHMTEEWQTRWPIHGSCRGVQFPTLPPHAHQGGQCQCRDDVQQHQLQCHNYMLLVNRKQATIHTITSGHRAPSREHTN